MADTNGNTADSLIRELSERPFAFDFFRAIRLVESRCPGLPRIGFSVVPREDPVRFWQYPSLRFAPSSIDSVQPQGPDAIPRIAVDFFGLFGPNAPLPSHITEYAMERAMHHHDHTLTAFFNVFHHRLISFFYRAWAANQKALDLDRWEEQKYAIYIGSFFGVGMETLRNQDAVPDAAKLFFSGRLSQQTRNVEGLEAILREYFDIPVEVLPFTGRWFRLPNDSACRLGDSSENGRLGSDVIVGSRFWDCQLSFRMRFGPMSLADYHRMLPNGDSFKRLRDWVLNYCGEHFVWDVQLLLKAGEVPATRLGEVNGLGWTTWLKTKSFVRDADDLTLNPPESRE